jgi:hypothetical protein
MPIFEPRYVLWCAPAFYVLAAKAFVYDSKSNLHKIDRLIFVVQAIVLTSISIIGLYVQFHSPLRYDIRSAVQFVRENWAQGDALVYQIPYTQHTFAYYGFCNGVDVPALTNRCREYAVGYEAPYTNNFMSPEQLDVAMYGVYATSKRLWLIESEPAMWDERGMARAWMMGNLPPTIQADFHGVRVSLHEHKLVFQRVYMPLLQIQ